MKKNLFIAGVLVIGMLLGYGAGQVSAATPKAFVYFMDNWVSDPDNDTLSFDAYYIFNIEGKTLLSNAHVTFSPTDTVNSIAGKMTQAVIEDAATNGVTLSKNSIIMPSFQKGS